MQRSLLRRSPLRLFLISTPLLLAAGVVAACIGDEPDLKDSSPDGSTDDRDGSSATNDAQQDSPADAAPPKPGSLDTSFNNGTITGVSLSFPRALAIDGQSRIYVGGSAACTTMKDVFSNTDIAVARFTADGSLDPTWGESGRACAPVEPDGKSSDTGYAAAVDSSGRLIVASTFDDCYALSCFGLLTLVRFNPDGTQDKNFGNGGAAKLTLAEADYNRFSLIKDLVIDGSFIYVAGGRNGLGFPVEGGWVVRFSATGTPDSSFGPNGVREVQTGSYESVDLALRNGTVWTAATTVSSPRKISIFGFAMNGTDAGAYTIGLGDSDNVWTSGLVVLGGGELVAAGVRVPDAGTAPDWGATTAIKISGGAPETTFGDGGASVLSSFEGVSRQGTILVQNDGKLLLSGVVDVEKKNSPQVSKSDYAFVRLTTSGEIDTAYGTNGFARASTGRDSIMRRAAIDPNTGKLVVLGGPSSEVNTLHRFNP